MTLFVLTETAAGYALHKAKDKKLLSRDNLAEELSTADKAANILRLKTFSKFPDAATATQEATAIVQGKVTPMLAKLLDDIKEERKVSLAVADRELGRAINNIPGLAITPIFDSATEEVHRAIRSFLPSLIPGLTPQDLTTMSLGLSHSLSRHKLKFSPEKVDIMIIQAISLLDDLDKEVNTYAMRVKEWYGWHFPEMAKIINDTFAYARVILKMGMRTQAADADLDTVLPSEIAVAVKAAANVSMGSEITQEDLECISALAEQVVEFAEYRQSLSHYLSTRMQAIAPSLTTLVGELVGARLIAHAGSVVNLAKSPASTIQILGSEKALFRAIKQKDNTPKYGLIFHASLVGQASGKNKGKIARMLAAKTALGLRVDALTGVSNEDEVKDDRTEEQKVQKAEADRRKIERKLRSLEGKPLGPRDLAPLGQTQAPKFELKEARKYNPNADGLDQGSQAIAGANEKMLIEEVNGEDAGKKGKTETPVNGLTNGHMNGADKTRKREREDEDEDEIAAKAERKAEKKAKRDLKAAQKAADKAAKETRKALKKVAPDADEDEDDEASAERQRLLEKAAMKAAEKEAKAEKTEVKAEKTEVKAEKKKRKHGGDDTEHAKKKKKRERV